MRRSIQARFAFILFMILALASVALAPVALNAVVLASPAFVYETSIPGYYLGRGNDMVVDTAGNAYVIASWYQDQQHLDILVIKLDPDGGVVWTLPITGDDLEHDYATDITLDSAENVWLTGWTDSESFPTVNALDDSLTGFRDAFIMKLDAEAGTILYSTLLGGDYTDRGSAIALNDADEIYIVGSTGSTNFPTTPDAYQNHPSAPLYIYEDIFLTKLSPDGQEILYSTYFGGFEDDFAENLALDSDGDMVFSGRTNADDFPLVNPIQSDQQGIFVAKLSADGSTLLFSTFLGGNNLDQLGAMDLDSEGYVYLTGQTRSTDFPTTAGAFQADFVGDILGCVEGFPGTSVNCFDAYLVKLATDGSGVIYGTYLGGHTNDGGTNIGVDDAGRAHVVGSTVSADFLGSGNVFGSIFVAGLDAAGSDLLYGVTKRSPGAGAGHGIALGPTGDVYFTGAVNIPYEIYVARLTGVSTAPAAGIGGTEEPQRLHLGPASPNPFKSSTRLTFSVPSGQWSPVRLTVHDARGRLVTTLMDASQGPGTHSVVWNGTDHHGVAVASGIYFYRIEWNGQSDSRRVVLLK